jgi:hypothetical protein
MGFPRSLLGTLVAACVVVAVAPTAHALDFQVDVAYDEHDFAQGDGVCATYFGSCTLRAAIEEANAWPGEDVILVPGWLFELEHGSLTIRDHVRILGTPSAASVVDGQGSGPIVWVDGSRGAVRVELHHLTIQHGDASQGGGILNDRGRLLVHRSRISGNMAVDAGAGIRNHAGGILSLVRSTVDDNGDPLERDNDNNPIGLPARAGGLDNFGIAYVEQSTISRNRANRFGGLRNAGTLIARNSTISGNLGDVQTGGLVNTGVAYFNNVTIADNHMIGTFEVVLDDSAGGLHNTGTVYVANTIIAGNTRVAADQQDCLGTLTSAGYNLVEDPGSNCTISGDGTGVLTGVDPALLPLADNGGDTETHALPARSPAVDAGNPARPSGVGTTCELVDQRDFTRGAGPGVGRCDIGAFERNASPGGEATAAPRTP